MGRSLSACSSRRANSGAKSGSMLSKEPKVPGPGLLLTAFGPESKTSFGALVLPSRLTSEIGREP